MTAFATSRYLNVIDLESSCLLFNGATGALDEVTRELGAALRRGDEGFLVSLGAEGRDFLAKRGHLTALDPDGEKERFRAYARVLHEEVVKHADERSSLMLLMSYECNLACSYCYQQMHRGAKTQPLMTEAMIDDLFGRHLPSIAKGKLSSISFYGGEPFLPGNAPVVRRALEHAKRLGLRGHAVSNATHVHRMPDCFGPEPGQVSEVQVSLDGDKAAHDSSRVTAAGGPTFERILDNVLLLLGRGVTVKLRVNMARERIATLGALMARLKEKGISGHPKAFIYTHPVHEYIGGADFQESVCTRELSDEAEKVGGLSHPLKRKADALGYLLKQRKGAGLMRTSFCMQTQQNCLVVDPYGDLYACYEEAGHLDLRVGRLADAGAEFFPRRDQYRRRHIANMEKCVGCSVALACGGGCGAQALEKNGDVMVPHCPGEKEDILEGVRLMYLDKSSGDAASAEAYLQAPEL
ncbi:MAG: hypothetical protein A2V88_01435 [Elusimicrobia bacterium RBG_16_66_12]|nr:MAG: hypothetical protein A2V88_01435 [Elusimicrobia bacterium RBG_16_66_12]